MEVAPTLNGLVQVWLTGSALVSATPSDVDLLVVYDPDRVSPANAIQFRRDLCEAIRGAVDLPGHIVVLTEKEGAETEFALREGGALIWEARR